MEPFIGQIQPFGFNFAPQGWAFCQGQLLPIASSQALFSLLGCTYGGDCRTTFGLPDLRGRSMISFGQAPGLSNYTWGAKGGTETSVLSIGNLPPHTHSIPALTGTATFGGNSESGGSVGNEISSSATNTDGADHNVVGSATTNPSVTGTTGSGQAINNRSPYLVVNICIALVGLYPSRG